MKSFSYFWKLCMVACLFAAGFASCSDDDGPGSFEDLIGTWELVSSEGWEKEDGEIVGEWNDNSADERIEFHEDGVFILYYKSGSWRKDYEGTFQYKGGKLYMYDDEGDLVSDNPIKVVTLTETTLVLEDSYKEREDGVLYEGYDKSTYRSL